MVRLARAVLLIALALAAGVVPAKTLRWTAQAGASTLDPHAEAELFTNIENLQVYEPLVRYDEHLRLAPSLATEWKATSPRPGCSSCAAA